MNVEHRTLNVQHPIMYSVNLKKGSARLLRQIGYQGQERNLVSFFDESGSAGGGAGH